MSYRPPKKESHALATFALLVIGIGGCALIETARIKTEGAHRHEIDSLNQRFDRVDQQNTQLGNFLVQAKGTITETDRKRAIQEVIRSKWISSHKEVDPDILSGRKMPPDEWVNAQLKAMREDWQVHTAPPTLDSQKNQNSAPAVSVVNIATQLPTKAGEDAIAEIRVSTSGEKAITVNMGELTALDLVFPNEASSQRNMENSLWDGLQEHDKISGTLTPLILPVNNKFLSIPVRLGGGLTPQQLEEFKAGKYAIYFMVHMEELTGKTLLDSCFWVNSKNESQYCREHNGP